MARQLFYLSAGKIKKVRKGIGEKKGKRKAASRLTIEWIVKRVFIMPLIGAPFYPFPCVYMVRTYIIHGGGDMRKGTKLSDETKRNMSISHMGHYVSPETGAKISAAKMGHTVSPEARAKISIAKRNPSPATRLKMSLSHLNPTPEIRARISFNLLGNTHGRGGKGRITSEETKRKLSAALWKGGTPVAQKRHNAKRRSLGYNPLNSPFIGCEGHHINLTDVIYIPKSMHQGTSHSIWSGRGMEKINALAGEYLTEDWT